MPLKVIETDTYRSATYDFLLTLHSNHGPISYRFQDKQQFQWKIANFPHPLYILRPAERVSLEIELSALGVKKLESWCYWADKEI